MEDNNLLEEPSYQAEKLRCEPSNSTPTACAANFYSDISRKVCHLFFKMRTLQVGFILSLSLPLRKLDLDILRHWWAVMCVNFP